MKVYLAGPMAGIPEFNYPAFNRVAALWRNHAKDEIVSPAELDGSAVGTPEQIQRGEVSFSSWVNFIARDLPILATCDALVMLRGWENSYGARIEAMAGLKMGKRFFGEDGRDLDHYVKWHFEQREEIPAPSGGDPRFHALLKQIGELHDKKAADYGQEKDSLANVRGSEDWGVPAWVGAMVRANDKLRRLQKFAKEGKLENEPAVDSFLDLAVYALIALILFQEEPGD